MGGGLAARNPGKQGLGSVGIRHSLGGGGQGGARRFVVGRIREPTSLLVKRHRLNHWTTREVPGIKHS